MYYINTLKHELVDTNTYKLQPSLSERVIVDGHGCHTALQRTKFLRCTGYLNSITHCEAKFITNSSSCMAAKLSKLLTLYLTAVKNMLSSNVKRYMRDQLKIYFGLLKSGEILYKLKVRDSNRPSLCTCDFSTLYTTLPHNLIKDKRIDLIEKPSREKALITLHVTTEMHFLLWKSLKISCSVVSKMYVIR